MSLFRRKPEKYYGRREQALSNPIRRRIVELFTTDEARPLTAKALAADLCRSATVSVGQVGYHLACLRDAGLIPGVQAKGR
jgi:DNA-binding transcriptional ArsR family regulator